MKKIYLMINLIWLCLNLNAQPSEVVKPTANAEQFKIGLSTAINHQAGQPVVSIPLFNLQARGLEIPISLSYNSGAVTHETDATSVGLGWSLLAGGTVTATVRGRSNFRSPKSEIPWQYNPNFLQEAFNKSFNPQYEYSFIQESLDIIMSGDGEPDDYSYSFLNFSGEICFKLDDAGKLNSSLYPDAHFILNKNAKGIRITDDKANNYFFEDVENQTSHDITPDTTAWYLTKIITNLGDSVLFYYENESYTDTKSIVDGRFSRTIYSKRITRIDFNNGYVLFKDGHRGDMVPSNPSEWPKRISNIELYDKTGVLVKGYELGNDTYFTNDNKYQYVHEAENYRMKLNKITEYNQSGDRLPSYDFNYAYHFERSKTSYKEWSDEGTNHIVNSWAAPPGPVAVLDRGVYGTPACRLLNEHAPDEFLLGFSTISEYFDNTVNDYLCLTKISYPTGGSETFEYELHDYSRISDSEKLTPSSAVIGRRVKKRILSDNNGGKQIFEYKYKRHDNKYNATSVSSGVLVTIPINTSVMYKPLVDENNHEFDRLQAIPYRTNKPQNSMMGQAVYYTEIEELFVAESGHLLGKKIYYYEKVFSRSAMNYMFVNYKDDAIRDKRLILTPIKNSLFGTQSNYPSNLAAYNNYLYTYVAYPMGSLYLADRMLGKIKREIVLDKYSRIVKKTENEYESIGSESLNGVIVEKFNDNITEHPDFNAYRYLISVTSKEHSYLNLKKSVTTDYLSTASDIVVTTQQFNFTPGGRLLSSTVTGSAGESITTENTYPDNIVFSAQSNLSPQAMVIKEMIEKNMTGVSIQITEKNNENFTNGTLTLYKQINDGSIVPDSIFSLEKKLLTNVYPPSVNNEGKLSRNSHFIPQMSIPTYNNQSNPTSTRGKDGLINTYVWDVSGLNILAKIENLNPNQLQGNTSLVNLFNSLNNYSTITDANLSDLVNCNQSIRSDLPATANVTTYTYKPFVGVTSITDPRGVMNRYDYDNFGRYMLARDNEGNILERYSYSYQSGINNVPESPTLTVKVGVSNFSPDYHMIGAGANVDLVTVSGGSGNYTYSWYLKNSNGVELTSNKNTASTSFSFICSQAGVLTAECVVTDNTTGKTAVNSVTLTCYNNLSVSIDAVTWYMVNDMIKANILVSEGSGDFSYTWKLYKGAAEVEGSRSSSETYNWLCPQTGILTLECSVKDNITGQTAVSSKIINCYSYPVLEISRGIINPSSTVPPTATTSVTVSGGSGSYVYNWYLLNTLTGSIIHSNLGSTSNSYTYTCPTEQNQTVKCVAIDSITGKTVEGTRVVTSYITPTITITTDAPSYMAGYSGISTVNVSGGSGDFTYYWSMKKANGEQVLSGQTTNNTWSFISSIGGEYTIQCTVKENMVSDLYITASSLVTYNDFTTGSFSFQSGFIDAYNSLSVSGSIVNFAFALIPAYNTMMVGNDYFIATIPGGFRPSTTRTLSYYTNGRYWQVTFNSNGNVYLKILSGSNLGVGTTVYIGTLTYYR